MADQPKKTFQGLNYENMIINYLPIILIITGCSVQWHRNAVADGMISATCLVLFIILIFVLKKIKIKSNSHE